MPEIDEAIDQEFKKSLKTMFLKLIRILVWWADGVGLGHGAVSCLLRRVEYGVENDA